jgi:hypothetical protein
VKKTELDQENGSNIELGQKVVGIIAVFGRDTGQSSVLFERKVE